MKKSLAILFCFMVITVLSQDAKVWRLGIQLGTQGNHSRYSSGMTEANARFYHNKYGAGALNIAGRYDFDNRWMVTGNLGLSSFGFEYGLAEDYSLLNKHRNFSSLKSDFSVLETSLMGFYKFDPNCKNARWLVGAGPGQYISSSSTINKGLSQANDGSTTVNYLSSTSSTDGGFTYFFRWSVAREKMYKRGGIFNAAILFNVGFGKIAESTVNYTVDNQNYNHTFSNNGNFVGLRLTYFFRPFLNPWIQTKK